MTDRPTSSVPLTIKMAAITHPDHGTLLIIPAGHDEITLSHRAHGLDMLLHTGTDLINGGVLTHISSLTLNPSEHPIGLSYPLIQQAVIDTLAVYLEFAGVAAGLVDTGEPDPSCSLYCAAAKSLWQAGVLAAWAGPIIAESGAPA